MEQFEEDFQEVYDSMVGCASDIPWVENGWKGDTAYKQAYDDFWTAREHLCQRFGIDWEDDDLERFMNGILKLEQYVSRKMFEYGAEYANREFQL